MFNNFLRTNRYVAAVLLFLRLYLGYSWLSSGLGKLTAAEPFNAGGFLAGAVAKATGDHPSVQGWWAAFLEGFAIPNADLFSTFVVWGEILAGLGLILGCFTTLAALGAMAMNFAFLFSGTVSTNPQMLLLEIFVVVAGANAGRYGLDRWVLPYMKALIGGWFHRTPDDRTGGETPTKKALAS